MSRLLQVERFKLARMLRWFVKTTPELEDLTGYGPGYYNRLLDNFIKYGTPTSAEEQDRLKDLILEAFSK